MFFLLVLPSQMVAWEQTSGCLYLLGVLLGGHEPLGGQGTEPIVSLFRCAHPLPPPQYRRALLARGAMDIKMAGCMKLGKLSPGP